MDARSRYVIMNENMEFESLKRLSGRLDEVSHRYLQIAAINTKVVHASMHPSITPLP